MSHVLHRTSRRVRAVASLALAAGLLVAAPVLAHEGHGSCGEAAQTFTKPAAQSGEFGGFVSQEAQDESAGVGEESEGLHAEGCEPRP